MFKGDRIHEGVSFYLELKRRKKINFNYITIKWDRKYGYELCNWLDESRYIKASLMGLKFHIYC